MAEIIRILPREYEHAAYAGFLRQKENRLIGRQDANNFDGDGWGVHVTGAVGEFVAAKVFGLFWAGPGEFRGADVGNWLQVKTTDRPEGCLIVKKWEPENAAYVLVVSSDPLTYSIPGWFYGGEAKQKEFFEEKVKGRPAYFVPQGRLRPIAGLKEHLRSRERASV